MNVSVAVYFRYEPIHAESTVRELTCQVQSTGKCRRRVSVVLASLCIYRLAAGAIVDETSRKLSAATACCNIDFRDLKLLCYIIYGSWAVCAPAADVYHYVGDVDL